MIQYGMPNINDAWIRLATYGFYEAFPSVVIAKHGQWYSIVGTDLKTIYIDKAMTMALAIANAPYNAAVNMKRSNITASLGRGLAKGITAVGKVAALATAGVAVVSARVALATAQATWDGLTKKKGK
jgi:hypothetical protein